MIGPVAALVLALEYTGHESWLTLRGRMLLTVVPIITVALVWTNELHGLIWSTVRIDTSTSIALLDVDYGVWFIMHTAYSYLVMIFGMLAGDPRAYSLAAPIPRAGRRAGAERHRATVGQRRLFAEAQPVPDTST